MQEELKNKQIRYEREIASHFKYKKIYGNTKIDDEFNIVIFTEDTEYGYEFIEKYIKTCYKDKNITLVSTGGCGNFRFAYRFMEQEKFDYAIFVYDRGKTSKSLENIGNNRTDIKRAILKYKKFRNNTKIFVFSPLSFESIFMSFEYLLTDYLINYNISEKYTSLHKDCVSIMSGELSDDILSKYTKYFKSLERLMEDSIENITRDTVYQISHNPSYMSECWHTGCECENKIEKCHITDVSSYINYSSSKIELLSAHSSLGGLTYILDKIYGYKFRKLPKAFGKNQKYINKLVEEVT